MAFSPSLHSLTGKSMGMSQATPTDARSYFFDETNFVYRPYQDEAEVLSYLNLAKYRTGNFYIFINDGGTLNGDGTFTGGTISTWTFKDGVTDPDLVEVTFGSTPSTFSDVEARIFDVRDYGLIVDDPAEEANNTAKMDTLLADWLAARGGTIYFPEKGIYYVSCTVPNVNAESPTGGGFTPFPFRFLGGVPPYLAQGTVVGGLTRVNDEWTIIRTTTSTPAITTGATGNFTIGILENIECQSTGSAPHCVKISGNQAYIRGNVLITNGTWGNMNTWPINNIGLLMPGDGNGGLNSIDNLAIVGFKTGIYPGEHLVANHLAVYYCETGILNIPNHHVNYIARYQGGHNKYDLVADGVSSATNALMSVQQFDCEASGNTVANIYDPNSILFGNVNWWNVKPAFGWYNNFVIVGTNHETFKAAQVGSVQKDFVARGPLLQDATRYVPTNNLDAWGETAERDAWYSYGRTAELGITSASAEELPAGTDGWIAQQYVSKSRGALVGLKTSVGDVIGFAVNSSGIIISHPGDGSTVSTSVAAVDGTFYRLNRVAGTYTIESSDDDGASWNIEYTVPSAFGGTVPSGDYTAHMQQGLIGTNTHFEAGVFYPQGNLVGGPDVTPPTLVSATVEDATPDQVDLVFDEPMNATWSATGAWAVSGHTVTGVTRVGPTTGFLTVTPDFVASETSTLDYTAPGTNDMQDLAGNLLVNITGEPIDDNVGLALPAGLYERWSAGSGTSLVGGEVDTWTGTENGEVLTAASAGTRPVFNATGGMDNQPYLEFTGTQVMQHLSTLGASDDYTTVFVMKNPTAATGGGAYVYGTFATSTAYSVLINADGINNSIEANHTGDVGANARKTQTPGTTTWFFAIARNHKSLTTPADEETLVTVNGATTLVGTQSTADNTNGFATSGAITVGALDSVLTFPVTMDLCEILVWPRILTAGEESDVATILQATYPSIP